MKLKRCLPGAADDAFIAGVLSVQVSDGLVIDPDTEIVRPHFDADYYIEEYPDIDLPRDALLTHYCTIGWQEGRNPSPFFDTVAYLLQNIDVSRANTNPLLHYLRHGIHEERGPAPSATPSVRTSLLFGVGCTDWVARLDSFVDAEFYRAQFEGDVPPALNLVAHFAYRGWREGKSPSPKFTVTELEKKYPTAVKLIVNPLLAHVKTLAGEYLPQQPTEAPSSDETAPSIAVEPPPAETVTAEVPNAAPQGVDTDQIEAIRSEFSAEYYLSEYKDLAASEIDPLLHFHLQGWREGRNPNQFFNTSYYLRSNEDIRAANINPFWHYVVAGRAEGRRQNPAGGYRRQVIDAAREPALRTENYAVIAATPMSGRAVEQKIASWAKGRAGVVVSLSHDNYTSVIGGTQLVISDEQRLFNANGYGYVHLSPRTPLLTLAQDDPNFILRIVLDGELLGFVSLVTLLKILRKRGTMAGLNRIIVIHSILGFNVVDVCHLWSTVGPSRSFFWLHDFSSVCEGFNLLRNDVAFCSAPSAEAMACRVCIYGGMRREHLARVEQLFRHCKFEVVAPSRVAFDLWRSISDLPVEGEHIHPNWTLRAKQPARNAKSRKRGVAVSVAFLGYPSVAKGWPIFSEIVAALEHDERYEFYHFVAPGHSSLPGVRVVPTQVSSSDRNAAIRLLRKNHIDFVAMLSPWPETFSFVAHEALVAGANVICLQDSGNVAALVSETGCGVVLQNAEAIIEFFVSGAAVALRNRARAPREFKLVPSGATASIVLPVAGDDRR